MTVVEETKEGNQKGAKETKEGNQKVAKETKERIQKGVKEHKSISYGAVYDIMSNKEKE